MIADGEVVRILQIPVGGGQTSMAQVRRMLALASRAASSVVW